MKKMLMSLAVATLMFGAVFTAPAVMAQDQSAAGELVAADGSAAKKPAPEKKGVSFLGVVFSGDYLGTFLWLCLFGCGAAAIYFIVDGYILVRPKKIMPQELIDQVKEAMDQGDVMRAIEICDSDPSSMAKILKAGFSHVGEGFDVIDEAIGAAGDLEIEHMMQRLNWISVCANLGPMLGLLGTVEGMILTFAALAINGVGDIGALALTISQALYTTAGGLCIAIPAVTFFYVLRNSANRLVLRMQVVTSDLIKNLRNAEVVEE